MSPAKNRHTRSLSDKKEVDKASQKIALERRKEIDDIREVLSTLQGRRFLWRVMEKCKVFGSVWEPSAKIHYNAGKQDLGHFLLSEITDADEEKLFLMMKEIFLLFRLLNRAG